MKKYTNKAFTLVELLIVIGIIGILAVTLLVNLNPAEAQKKTRDATRLKDALTIQTIIEQMITDNVAPAAWADNADYTLAAVGATGTYSSTAAGQGNQPCTANWLGLSVCNYAKTVPRDPLNGRLSPCANPGANASCLFTYVIELSGDNTNPGVNYEVNVRQESTANAAKMNQDGGNQLMFYELFSSQNNIINNAAL